MKLPFKKKPWEGAQIVEIRLLFPAHSWMLCRLLAVDPEKLILDFLTTLGGESYSRQGPARQLLEEYLLHCDYGQQHYTPEDIRLMLEELRAIGLLWPREASRKITQRHTAWRNMYHQYWYRKWYDKNRRKH
ncbi:hypothetical protein [Cesiribacter andamanensis]|uniref:Uncharacterized protein n=1 Tax=Cesiribacter andamanensis AMV16 TaxID=1279009 RepID=M7NR10_9BACT|nr:hypothetical protein [Cesiribacter andamanensis]EMR04150.1 hypothetical protein ADICEAN_00674 [Cesiribacter andamanensis AMV16]